MIIGKPWYCWMSTWYIFLSKVLKAGLLVECFYFVVYSYLISNTSTGCANKVTKIDFRVVAYWDYRLCLPTCGFTQLTETTVLMLASHYVMIYQLMGFKIILDYITLPFNKNINHVAPHFLNNYADCEQTLETKTYGVHTSRFRRKIPLCSAIDRTRSCCLWWACWASCVYGRNRIFPWSCMVLTSHSEPGIMSAIHDVFSLKMQH